MLGINAQDIHIFRNILQNRIFLFVLVLSASLQFLIVEFGGTVFRTQIISWSDWLICIAFGFGSIPVGFLVRMLAPDEVEEVVVNEIEEIKIHDEVKELHTSIIGFLEQVWFMF